MSYILRGNLCGLLCDDCSEPLSGLTVRLYQSGQGERVAVAAAASAKETFSFVSDQDVHAKSALLLGEAVIDGQGDFAVQITDDSYRGEPFDLDLYCSTVPHLVSGRKAPDPVQVSVTTLAPQWREIDGQYSYAWRDCIPNRYWCAVRGRLGAWMICGRVVTCEGNEPIPGVVVSAFDTDWTQDDALGSATTDSVGHFRIDYNALTFERTPFPFLHLELVPGPDLYFSIATPGGDVLLSEDRSVGRQPGRQNVGHCFCVELCLPQQPVIDHAWFTHVGDFAINSDINLTTGTTLNAAPVGPGAHGGPGFGFYEVLRLIGDCPAIYPGGTEAMRYRFLVGPAGAALSSLTPITAGQIDSVQVGTRPIPWIIGGTTQTTFQSIVVASAVFPGGTPAGPPPTPAMGPVPPEVLVPDANGWITVDPSTNLGGFSGPLLPFDSRTVVAGGTPAMGSAGSAPPILESGSLLQVVFQAEPVSGPTVSAPTITNALSAILVNNWTAVNEVYIEEFIGAAETCCSPLSTGLDIQYTADHQLMDNWSVGLSSCATFPATTLPSGTTPRGGHGTAHVDISNSALWPQCSYVVSLSTTTARTDGLVDDSGFTTQVTFCIDR